MQARLLQDIPQGEAKNISPARNSLRAVVVVLIMLVPLASLGLYWMLGNRNAILPQASHPGAMDSGVLRTAAELKLLEDHLRQKPEDPQEWLLLARSYVEMERFEDAARAYGQLTKLAPKSAQLWADYADALALVNGESLIGAPTALLDKALELDPNNPKALWLAGSAAMERSEFGTAIRYWEKLRAHIPDNTEVANMVDRGIQQARAALAQTKSGQSMAEPRSPEVVKKKPAAGSALPTR